MFKQSCQFQSNLITELEISNLNAFELINRVLSMDNTLFLIDENVYQIYFAGLQIDKPCYILKAEEQHKSLYQSQEIYNFLLTNNCSRNHYIVVFGGGISTDIGAWIASTFKRGTKLLLIPTTLLAMIDAALGGKTALNHNGIKNLIGSFYPADKIIICPSFLQSLPADEYYNGLVECLKTLLIIQDFDKANKLLSEKIINEDDIYLIANTKLSICANDLYDKGARRLLNLGHSFAHIIESLSDNAIPHGAAVAWGMLFAYEYSLKKKLLDIEKTNQLKDLLNKLIKASPSLYQHSIILFSNIMLDKAKTQVHHLILNDKKNNGSLKLILFDTQQIIVYQEDNIEEVEIFFINQLKSRYQLEK